MTENTTTVIDDIFSNNIQDNTISGNILLTPSEHFSQFLSVKREMVGIKKVNIYQRDYTNFSSDSFREDVSIQNWKYTHDNVHDSFSDFYPKLEGSVNRHAPLKKLTPEEVKLKSKPWLNVEIQKLIKIRNKVFARKKRQPNNVNHKRLYNLIRNRINRDIKKSKRQYYAEYFATNVNDMKKTWEGIRKIVNIKKMSPKISQLNIGGKIIDDDKELATNTENAIPKVPNILPSKFLKNRNQINFVIAHISNEEILDIINSLENKATGPFSIPMKLLSLIPDLIIIPLAYIINMSLLTGVYPDLLKLVILLIIDQFLYYQFLI